MTCISEGQRCFSTFCNCRNSVFRKKKNPFTIALSVLFLSSFGKLTKEWCGWDLFPAHIRPAERRGGYDWLPSSHNVLLHPDCWLRASPKRWAFLSFFLLQNKTRFFSSLPIACLLRPSRENKWLSLKLAPLISLHHYSAATLKCYECLDLGVCSNAEKQCPASSSLCGATRVTSYVGNWINVLREGVDA